MPDPRDWFSMNSIFPILFVALVVCIASAMLAQTIYAAF